MQASLDCLTDGSDYTGGPAIFLTLRKLTKSSEDEGSILARYNLTGLPTLTGRLSSDQSYQLLSGGCFRCILLPSLNDCGGLASLFLSLVQFGYKALSPTSDGHCSDSESSMENDNKASTSYGDITIVGPQNTSALVDGILDTLFGNNRKRPSIRLCEVPLDKNECWWDVYQDSYVRIWAQSVDSNFKKRKRPDFSSCNHPSSADHSTLYIAMIKPYPQTKIDTSECNSRPISFAILPQSKICTNRLWDTLRNLPQEVIGANKHDYHLDFVLHLDPCKGICTKQFIDSDVELTDAMQNLDQVAMLQLPEWIVTNKLSRHYVATFPDCQEIFDPGILIRAQQRSLLLYTNLPFAFPLSGSIKYMHEDKHKTIDECLGNRNVDCLQLKSCSSITLPALTTQSPFVSVSKRETIFNRCSSNTDSETKPELDPNMVLLLRNAYFGDTDHYKEETAATDVNEIDLDNFSVNENNGKVNQKLTSSSDSDLEFPDPTIPHLLLLGTGCATPSSLRGSSSYAVFLPTSIQTSVSEKTSHLVLSTIIECGEGTLTSLSRHLPQSTSNHSQSLSLDEQLRWVRLIWISHSHLDHYGDLPCLIKAIVISKARNNVSLGPLVVVAPVKVLKFLRVMLRSSAKTASTKANSIEHSSYIGITHREFQISPFASNIKTMLFEYALPIPSHDKYEHLSCEQHMYHPFASIRNVEVEHCRDAFALILALRFPLKNNNHDGQPFVLCFSGDTRPSNNLVHECRSHCLPQANSAYWQHAPIPPPPPPRVSLLLHEATFINDDHGRLNAVKKLHSTAAEALEIAKRMQVEACLLTHFSQRYTHVSIVDASFGAISESNSHDASSFPDATTKKHSFSWGIAVDGMLIPLTKQVTAMLHTLSLCVDKLLSK